MPTYFVSQNSNKSNFLYIFKKVTKISKTIIIINVAIIIYFSLSNNYIVVFGRPEIFSKINNNINLIANKTAISKAINEFYFYIYDDIF